MFTNIHFRLGDQVAERICTSQALPEHITNQGESRRVLTRFMSAKRLSNSILSCSSTSILLRSEHSSYVTLAVTSAIANRKEAKRYISRSYTACMVPRLKIVHAWILVAADIDQKHRVKKSYLRSSAVQEQISVRTGPSDVSAGANHSNPSCDKVVFHE